MSNPLRVIVTASTALRVPEVTVANSLVITEGVNDSEIGRIYLGGKRLVGATVGAVARSSTHPGAIVTIDGRKFAVGGVEALEVTISNERYIVHGDPERFVFAGPLDEVNHDPATDIIS